MKTDIYLVLFVMFEGFNEIHETWNLKLPERVQMARVCFTNDNRRNE